MCIHKIVDLVDTHPHNYYLQLLSETVIFGILFLIYIYLLIIKDIFLINLDKKKN